jgi:glycosyltransferase involved in cell wall biosynthesis
MCEHLDTDSELWMNRMIADVCDLLCAIATSGHSSSRYGLVPVYSLEQYSRPRRALFRLGVGPDREAVTQCRLANLLQLHRPKVVVTNFLNWSLQFSETLNNCGAAILCHTHGRDQVPDLRSHTPPHQRIHPENYRQRILAETKSWQFLANSQYSIEALRQLGIDRDRIHLKPFGYSAKGYTRARPERIRFLYLGRLVDVKGPLETIRAFESASARGLDADLIIAGDGPLYQACAEARLASAYSDRIKLLGKVSEQEGQQLRHSATAFVAHSRTGPLSGQTEAFGVAFLEAIADGLPVITGASGGVTEIVTHGKSGILFEPGDIEAQANALLALANDPNLRERLKAGALFDAQRYTGEMARVRLREIIEAHLS